VARTFQLTYVLSEEKQMAKKLQRLTMDHAAETVGA
jgi:hypothetical protein